MCGTVELLFWLAGVAMPVIAIGAILYAKAQVEHTRAQVEEAKKYSEIIAKQAAATMLLNLLDKWNSDEMQAARKLFREKQSELRKQISQIQPGLNEEDAMKKLEERFENVLNGLYRDDLLGNYTIWARLISFFETVGLLVQRKYILFEDADQLFRGPILQIGAAFHRHIVNCRQQEKGVAPGLWTNAIFLFLETQKNCPKR